MSDYRVRPPLMYPPEANDPRLTRDQREKCKREIRAIHATICNEVFQHNLVVAAAESEDGK